MENLLTSENNLKQKIDKKIYNLKAERLIREAHDNFLYFKDYEMALEQAEEVLDLDATNEMAFILKGNILFCLDEMDRAQDCVEKALQLEPESAEAHGLMANILDMKGNTKEALDACENAFKNLRKRNKEILTSLYDQKIAILIKLRRYTDAQKTLKESYKNLGTEDSFYMASCYRDVIHTLHNEKIRKNKIANERLIIIDNS